MQTTGILLIQLGTPDAPTAKALKPYLKQFLSDPRVIDVPSPIRWLIRTLTIVKGRPKDSAEKYARIWDAITGSPLMHYTQRQTELLQAHFPDHPVRFGMQIGQPSVREVVHNMIREGVDRLIVLPMYPQYSATTTASAMDSLFKALMQERRIPAVRIVPPYYRHPAYLDAMAAVIRDDLERLPWTPDYYLYSFHGIPIRYSKNGDPYATHVKRTVVGLQKRLQWPKGQWQQTFQSLFGREEWLKPYTDVVLEKLAHQGIKRVFVTLPGFTADCLETVDEIGNESAEVFKEAGGNELRSCPCLNDHPRWIEGMASILREEGQGWLNETVLPEACP